jgi:hypothetical protein
VDSAQALFTPTVPAESKALLKKQSRRGSVVDRLVADAGDDRRLKLQLEADGEARRLANTPRDEARRGTFSNFLCGTRP